MKKILFLILPSLFALSVNAASIRGGEITFRQTAPLALEATAYLYIQANATNTVPDSISLCWGDGNCSTAYITNGVDADNDGLPDGESLTTNQLLGVYQVGHLYEAAGQYTLFVNTLNRVGGILNIGNSSPIAFYMEALATVTTSAEPHYSPVFYEPAMLDRSVLAFPFTHLPTVFDRDDDEVVHTLATPKAIDGPIAAYQELTQVVPGANNQFTISPVTGLLTWDAPQRDGRYLINVVVSTYRDGALWEQVTRDMLIEVEDLMARPPVLELDNAALLQEVLVGDMVELGATSQSIPFGGEVELTAAGGLLEFFDEPAVFLPDTGIQPNSTFTWTVEPADERTTPYLTGFKAKDLSNGLAVFVPILHQVVDELTDTEEPPLRNRLRVFPNPVSEVLTVDFSANAEPAFYQLFRADGVLLQSGQWTRSPAEVNVQSFPAGVYHIKITGLGTHSTAPFIVARK